MFTDFTDWVSESELYATATKDQRAQMSEMHAAGMSLWEAEAILG